MSLFFDFLSSQTIVILEDESIQRFQTRQCRLRSLLQLYSADGSWLRGSCCLCLFEICALLHNSKNNHSFDIEDGTLFVPLVLCFPSNLKVDGIIIVDSTNVTSPAFVEQIECHQLDYLMSACASSLLFAAAGCALFVFCDFLARFSCCPFDMNSSSGMAIFLCFLLVQAGISVGALAEQNHVWVEHYKEIVDERDLDLKVESYAHWIFLVGSAFSSFGIAFLVLLDATCSRCCQYEATVRSRRHEEEDKHEKGFLGWKRQAREVEDAGHKGRSNQANINEQENVEYEDGVSTIAGSSGRVTSTLPQWSDV